MIPFQMIKTRVTARQAADLYGLTVGRNGMARCPFHPDQTPSMRVDRRYFCFGCGAAGDVIDLTAQLLGLSPKEAALRLAADFRIPTDWEPEASPAIFSTRNRDRPPLSSTDWQRTRTTELAIIRRMLLLRETEYTPHEPGAKWHPKFCGALLYKDRITFLLDELLASTADMLPALEASYRKEIDNIVQRYRTEEARQAADGTESGLAGMVLRPAGG